MFRVDDSLDSKRSRYNAGFLQSTLIDSNLQNSVSGQSLIYNGSRWINSYPLGGIPFNLSPPAYDGQVLTYNGSSWVNDYPRYLRNIPLSSTTPSNTQVLTYDSILQTWKPGDPIGQKGDPGFAHFGNVAVVDTTGNDSTANINGNPFSTIEGAIAKINDGSLSGITIWVMPGVYTLPSTGILIPNNTSLRGISLQAVILQRLNVTSDTTLITMGETSRLEDVTINLTSASDVNLTAIKFPGSTPKTAKVRVCLINVTSTVPTLTKTICGIFGDGSTTNPNIALSTNAVQRTTTNVTGNNTSGSGKIRGWYFTGALQFSVRDTVIFANGGGSSDCIGVETINLSSFVIIKTSTISGTTYDIKQPANLVTDNSGIQLCGTDLINANAGANGFRVNIETSSISFSITGNFGDRQYHYLLPGTTTFNSLSESILGFPFSQNVIIYSGILSAITSGMSGTATIRLYKSTSSTSKSNSNPFVEFFVNSTNNIRVFNNTSSTFRKQTDFLIVELETAGGIGTSIKALLLHLSTY
jgi:hypothetical protein